MSVCQYWAEQDQGSKKEKLLRVAIDKHFRFEENPTIVYNDYKSPFQKLLELDNSVSICDRNYLNKVKNGLQNEIMSELFELRNTERNLHSDF